MFAVFLWQLYEIDPQNCRKKLGDEVVQNLHNVEEKKSARGLGAWAGIVQSHGGGPGGETPGSSAYLGFKNLLL